MKIPPLMVALALLTACATGQRPMAAPFPDPVSASLNPILGPAHYTQVDFDRLGFLVGCWEGHDANGPTALRVTRSSGILTMAVGSDCTQALPLLEMGYYQGEIAADSAKGSAGHYRWTARTVSPNELVLAPVFAPVWFRWKLLPSGQLEWSTSQLPDAPRIVVLNRAY